MSQVSGFIGFGLGVVALVDVDHSLQEHYLCSIRKCQPY